MRTEPCNTNVVQPFFDQFETNCKHNYQTGVQGPKFSTLLSRRSSHYGKAGDNILTMGIIYSQPFGALYPSQDQFWRDTYGSDLP